MKRLLGMVLVIVLLTAMVGCGKDDKKPENETATPTSAPTETATPTEKPTDTPDDPGENEGPQTVLGRIAAAAMNVFTDGNCRMDISETQRSEGETYESRDQMRMMTEEDGAKQLYRETKDSDDSTLWHYAYLTKEGGYLVQTWYEPGLKFEYDTHIVSGEDAQYMWTFLDSLSPDIGVKAEKAAPLVALNALMAKGYPGIRADLVPESKGTLEQVVASLSAFDTEAALKAAVGWSRDEDGTDHFKLPQEAIQRLLAAAKQEMSVFVTNPSDSAMNKVELDITYQRVNGLNGIDRECLKTLTLRFAAPGASAEYKIEFSNIGTTTFTVPKQAGEEYEKLKSTYKKRLGDADASNWLAENKLYYEELLSGVFAEDDQMVRDVLNAYAAIAMKEENKDKIIDKLTPQDTSVVLMNGDSLDKTGIDFIDEQLRELYPDLKFDVKSKTYRDTMSLKVWFIPENGKVEVYYKVYYDNDY
ncbi:MAG: hypothetical protein IJM57_04225 [Lachnospiraceae bacterium]|nr:hypothetical protein [Lachnospiraceae bacterium]